MGRSREIKTVSARRRGAASSACRRFCTRAAALVLAFLLCVAAAVPHCVGAAGPYRLEVAQISTSMPKIVVYFRLVDVEGADSEWTDIGEGEVSASLDGKPLETVSVERQADSEYGVTYYYLLDVSSSSPQAAFSSVKEGIVQHISSKSDKDRVVVITFGEQVKVLLDGSEGADEARAVLDGASASENGTRLYDAVSKAVELADAVDDELSSRNVVMLVTDGYDESTGAGTRDEAAETLKRSGIPLYALGYGSGRASSLDALGELARSTGGMLTTVGRSDGAQAILNSVKEIAYTYRAEFRAENNVFQGDSGTVTLRVQSDETYETARQAVFTRWIKDTAPPAVSEIAVSGEKSLSVLFSEDVAGAGEQSAYVLTTEKGEAVPVESASYDSLSRTAVLTLKDTFYNGTYRLGCVGITDVSREENPLADEFVFTAADAREKDIGYFLGKYWYIPAGAAATVCVAVLCVVLKKRSKRRQGGAGGPGGEPVSLPGETALRGSVILGQADSLPVEVTVIDRNGLERRVNAAVAGAYIIGRDAELCDLCIEDKRLSRQHCALMYEDGMLKIRDLGSTNGTRVNGIAVSHPRSIIDGDIIEAANTRLRVRRR